MKKFIYLLIIAAIMAACTTTVEPQYVIKGKIAGADSVTFILQKRVAGKTIKLDSAMVLNGEFTIKGGKVDYPESVTLLAKNMRKGMSLYLENSKITITGHIDSLYNATITGSKSQDEYKAFMTSMDPLKKKNQELYKVYQEADKAGDKAKVAEIEKQFEDLSKEMTQFQKEFVKNNPASYVAPSILSSLSYDMEPAEIEALINAMDTSVAKIQLVVDLKDRVAVMKTVAVGQKAPDFTMNDVDGNPITLSSKIGKSKLLLVDFWAAWCGPCRGENPNVVKVWKEWNKKGFDVFGVSLDQKKEDWVKAIADDKLTWTHVSDLQYWSNAAAKMYAVNAIPANFLLDEQGTIIARNLRGEDLANKVKELLGGKK